MGQKRCRGRFLLPFGTDSQVQPTLHAQLGNYLTSQALPSKHIEWCIHFMHVQVRSVLGFPLLDSLILDSVSRIVSKVRTPRNCLDA
jgi:hypothetical protein